MIERKQVETETRLAALLFRPVQRLCIYPLLFKQALDFADPSSELHSSLSKAYEATESTISSINDDVRHTAEQRRTAEVLLSQIGHEQAASWMSAARILTLEAMVDMKVVASSVFHPRWNFRREYKWYLMNDCLLICHKNQIGSKYHKKLMINLHDVIVYSVDDANTDDAGVDDGSRRQSLEAMALPENVDNHKSKRRSVRARLAKAALPKSLPPSASGDAGDGTGGSNPRVDSTATPTDALSSDPAPVPLHMLSGGVPSSLGGNDSGRTTGTWLVAGGGGGPSMSSFASCESLAVRTGPVPHGGSSNVVVSTKGVRLQEETDTEGLVSGPALSFDKAEHHRSKMAQRVRAGQAATAALARSMTLARDKREVLRLRCPHAEYKCWAADGDERVALIAKIRELQRAMTAAAGQP